MRIGFVGLGKMGSQIVTKFLGNQIEVVVYDVNADAIKAMADAGAEVAGSREDLVSKLGDNPVLWLMIPSDFVEAEIQEYSRILPPGSLVIDGGNSDFRMTIKRAVELAEKKTDLVDIGTSGGVRGLKNGFSLMVGGSPENYAKVQPLLEILAMPSGSYGHMGPTGSGHYVKMIHNGVEYGMMQSLAEGYNLLKTGPVQPVDLKEVARIWQHGSIVESTLNELIAEIMSEDSDLSDIEGYVADSGEGRWTLETAKQSNVPMPALEQSLEVRVRSQQGQIDYSTKLLAAIRNKFGGHSVEKPKGPQSS